MEFAKIVLVCCVAVLVAPATSDEDIGFNHQRIIKGAPIHIDSAPYIVQLRDVHGTVWCGGSLVTPQYVVTAAHCLDYIDPIEVYRVVGGANTKTDKGVLRRIIDFHVPNDYTRKTFNDDVAVLKLESPMTGQHIRTIPLGKKPLVPGDEFKVSGWGRTVPNGEVSYDLRTITVRTISPQDCRRTFQGLTSTMVCGLLSGSGPCQYDSGGPAVRNNELVAIVSWGKSNCQYANPVPAVYTSVDAVRAYIENALKQ